MKSIFIIVLSALSIIACSSLSVAEKESKRDELNTMAAQAIAGLVEQDETLQKQMDKSLGYAVANMKVTKVPIVGAGVGEGVYVNKKTGKRSYFTVSRLDIGGGWGVRSYKLLKLFKTQKAVDAMQNGGWEFQTGIEASAGTAAAEGSSGSANEDYTVHVLLDGGASATATVRVIRIKVNSELAEN